MLQGIFLIAGILLLFNRLSPRYYVHIGHSIFQTARRGVALNGTRKTVAALGSHPTSPFPTPDKRYDFDGSCVIVSSNFTLAHEVPKLAEHFPALPEKLSFPSLVSISLRGPPAFFS